MKIPPLFKNQSESIAFLLAHSRAYDASDPGTGKTRTQIETFKVRRAKGLGCALIIAPRSLLRTAWEADFLRFAPELRTSVCPAVKRAEHFGRVADAYITNTDAVVWLAKQPAKFFKKFEHGTLIIDEASAFKHHTSARSRALNKIKKYFEFRYALSGTPNSVSVLDLWHPMYIIDDGKHLGASFYHFRAAVCEAKQVGPQPNMLKWIDKPGSVEAVADMISPITIRHALQDCQDIPDNHQYIIPYYAPTTVTKPYEQMAKLSLAQVGEEFIDAINAAAVATKLLQILSGAVYDGTGTAHLVDTARYELITDLVAERQHSLVFFNWTHQRDELIRQFNMRGISYMLIDGSVSDRRRLEYVQMYQQGMYQVGLLHPRSAAHGLTLTRATTTLWPQPVYDWELFKQGNHRAYRAGQKLKTETITLVTPETLEEKVYEVLTGRGNRQFDLLTMLKALQ